MFSVSEYFDLMEKASLEILGARKPIDKTITLWWGLDGIQLSEDGTYKRVSRKKKQDENALYQPCQSIQWTAQYAVPVESGMLRSQIEGLQMRVAAQQTQSFSAMRMASMTQRCCCDNFWR